MEIQWGFDQQHNAGVGSTEIHEAGDNTGG